MYKNIVSLPKVDSVNLKQMFSGLFAFFSVFKLTDVIFGTISPAILEYSFCNRLQILPYF